MRSFSIAGPVKPAKHYCIPPLSRIDLNAVLGLVRDEKYFVLHAPRQTGKTSALLALADLLNERGYHCVYATVETAGIARGDVAQAIPAVLDALAVAADSALGDRFLMGNVRAEVLADVGPHLALLVALERWAQAAPRPLVLLRRGGRHRVYARPGPDRPRCTGARRQPDLRRDDAARVAVGGAGRAGTGPGAGRRVRQVD